MRYTTLLFDFDHTLFDSDESERSAYLTTMRSIGLAEPEAHFERYVDINRQMWAAVEAGTMQPTEVRFRRFEQFTAELGLDADPAAMADVFVTGLANHGELYPAARPLLERLHGRVTLAVVTNGLSEVQRTRIERVGIGGFFEAIVVSSEVGVTKPRREIFDRAFAQLGEPSRSTALMIGDSLTSDMAGGRNAGIDTCWYDPHGREADDSVTHRVASLDELERVLEAAPPPAGSSGSPRQ